MPPSMGEAMYVHDNILHKYAYPLAPPKRKRERPMQVLCLGLPRSGTDSLRHALTILGYSNVYHGFNITGVQREDCIFWIPYLKTKFAKAGYDNPTFIPELAASSEKFDSVLGDCEALTDAPAIHFSQELLQAYPEAKVILNRRQDLDKWHTSMKQTYLPMFGTFFWGLRWFDTGLFWLYRNFYLCVYPWVKWDFDGYGKEAATVHYKKLTSRMKEDGREWLDWSVEDGWEPLCRFLGKEVPAEEFPYLNAGTDGFTKNMNERIERTVKTALLRAIAIVGAVITGLGALIWSASR